MVQRSNLMALTVCFTLNSAAVNMHERCDWSELKELWAKT